MKKIFIKPENRDKFTATKKNTGKSTEELTHSSNPITKKRAVFAQNAKKWQHKAMGGDILEHQDEQQFDGTEQAITGGITAATDFATGNIVGGIASLVGTGASLLLGSKKAKDANAKVRTNNSRRDLQMATQELAKGGKIKGKGTGTSDSIPAKLNEGDFIVPAKNAEQAMKIRKEHFDAGEADTNVGDVPVKLSNGEVAFSKDEMDYLDEIGEGHKVRSLAPNAKLGNKFDEGGKVGKDGKTITDPKELLKEKKYREELRISEMNPITKKLAVPIDPITKEPVSFTGDNKLKEPTDYSAWANKKPVKNKVKAGQFIKDNLTSLVGAGQAVAGLVQSAKNSKEEKNLKPVQSQAAGYNDEAVKMKMAADSAASAINAGNEAEADKRMGNIVKMASEQSSNAASNLSAFAKAGDNTDSYLKGLQTVANTRLEGQKLSSDMRAKGFENAAQTDIYNDSQKRKLLETKANNANDLVKAGITNVVMAQVQKDYNTKMADLKKNVKDNVAGAAGLTNGVSVKGVPTNSNGLPSYTPSEYTPFVPPGRFDKSKPQISPESSVSNESNLTPISLSNKPVPDYSGNSSNSDNSNNSLNEEDRKKPYSMKIGGRVKKFKKVKTSR
jgi:hypothetical protein